MGLGLVVLTMGPAGSRPGRVEVAESRDPEAPVPSGLLEHALGIELGLAVGTDRTLRVVLAERERLGHPVGRTGRGEDELLDPGHARGLHQVSRPPHVDPVVALRLPHAVAHVAQGGEVEDAAGPDGIHDLGEALGIEQVALEERHLAGEGVPMSLGEVVQHRDRHAGSVQHADRVTPDVARPSGHEDRTLGDLRRGQSVHPPILAAGMRRGPHPFRVSSNRSPSSSRSVKARDQDFATAWCPAIRTPGSTSPSSSAANTIR